MRRRRIAYSVLLWGALFGASMAYASAEQGLSLAEAMARGRTTAEVAAAEARSQAGQARLEAARREWRPTLGLSQTWIRTDSPADVFGLLLNQERFSFPEFAASDPNDPEALSSATTRLELSWPAYGGGERSRRIRQAALAAEAAGHNADRTADQAAFDAAEAFVQLFAARQQVALLERAVATLDAHVDLAAAYVEQGMRVRSDLLRVQVERARLADALSAARGLERVAEARLAFRLGEAGAEDLRLQDLGEPAALAADAAELARWLDHADGRGDLAAARGQVSAAELEAEILSRWRLPRVGLSARHDRVDEDLFGTGGSGSTVVAYASIALYDGGRHGARKAAAAADAESAALEVARMAEGIRLEIRHAWTEALTARERLATARDTVAAAREAERITDERFRQGVARTLDLLDATTARTEAESRQAVALADAHLSGLRLALAAGLPPETLLPQPSTPSGGSP